MPKKFSDELRSQIVAVVFTLIISMAGAAVSVWANQRDLTDKVAANRKLIETAQTREDKLAQEVVELRIAAARLVVSVDQLTIEVQNLRSDIRAKQ
jgi:cell division protein FtsL